MKGCSNLLVFIFIGIAIVSLGLGVANYFHEQAIFAAYEPAIATVTDWIPDPNYGTPDYCPVYEYTTKEGDTRSYTGEDCVSKPDPSTIGSQQEEIYYDPENPYSSVETKGWFGSEGSGLILGGIGFLFFNGIALIMGISFFLAGRAQKRRSDSVALQGDHWAAPQTSEKPYANIESSQENLMEARIALAKIEELKSLRDANQINEAEYQKRKQEIQSKMRAR